MAHSIFIRLLLLALVVIILGCMFAIVSEAKSAPGDDAQFPTIAESSVYETPTPPQPLSTLVSEVEVVTQEMASLQVSASVVESATSSEAVMALKAESWRLLTDEDRRRFDEIRKILEAIPTGREVLKLTEDYQVIVAFEPGNGSFFADETNLMVIDSNKSPVEAAFLFVHEMNHAESYHLGMHVAPRSLEREEYVTKEIMEEAEGAVMSIIAKIELEVIGLSVWRKAYRAEQLFRKAFASAIESAKAGDKDITEEELYAIGLEAGKQGVFKGYMDGELVTSTTGQTYPSFYGTIWDEVQEDGRSNE